MTGVLDRAMASMSTVVAKCDGRVARGTKYERVVRKPGGGGWEGG